MTIVQVGLLGPLSVTVRDEPVALSSPKQRALLQALALRAGAPVHLDQLIDDMWGERPPPSAKRTLHSHVAVLRRSLPDDVLVTTATGYRLALPTGAVDSDRFEEALSVASRHRDAGDAVGARRALADGLALWRGPIATDIDPDGPGHALCQRLDELRRGAEDDAAELALVTGDIDAAVAELRRLVADQPLRERRTQLLMDALARSGQQAVALQAYEALRIHLRDELGVDPAPSTQAIYMSVLDGDFDDARRRTATASVREISESDVPPAQQRSVLVTDLQFAAGLAELLGAAYPPVVRRARQLVTEHAAIHGGRLLSSDGDACTFAFDSASAAVLAALASGEACAEESWPDPVTVALRSAVHTGPLTIVDGEAFGAVLHEAARVLDVAEGGDVIVTRSAANDARAALPSTLALHSLGGYRVPEAAALELFAVADAAPRAGSTSAPMSNDDGGLFVGRAADLDEVWVQVSAAASKAGVVLLGPAGIGKTRLAQAVRRRALDAEWTVEWANATSGSTAIPFGALLPLLPRLPVDSARLDDVSVYYMLQRALLARAGSTQLLLVVDDANHLDGASLTLLQHLLTAPTVRLLLTIRTGEIVPEFVHRLVADGDMERIDLAPLTRTASDRLMTELLGGEVESATSQRAWDLARGNALLLRELLLDARSSGDLVDDGGLWRWRPTVGPGARVTDVVEGRLGRASADARKVVDVLAFGEPLGPDDIAVVAGRDALERAIGEHAVVVEASGRRRTVRVAHPVYGEIARAQCSILDRDAIQRALAQRALAAGARRQDDAVRVGTWLHAAGDHGHPDVFLAAARAIGAADWGRTEEFARIALENGGGDEARLELAEALSWLHRYDEVRTLAHDLLASSDDPDIVAHAGSLAVAVLLHSEENLAASEQLLGELEARIGPNAWRLQARREELLMLNGQIREACELAFALVERSQHEPEVLPAVYGAAWWTLQGMLPAGELDMARELLERVGPLAAGNLPTLVSTASVLATLLRDGAAAAASELDTRRSDWQYGYMASDELRCCQARIALDAGDVVRAARALDETGIDRSDRPVPHDAVWISCLQAEAAAMAGDATRAFDRFAKGATFDRPGVDWGFAESVRVHALAEIARGEIDAARERVVAGAAMLRKWRVPMWELRVLHLAARLGRASEVVERAVELGEQISGAHTSALAAHVSALAARDPLALDAVTHDLEALGLLLFASEASAVAGHLHRVARAAQSSIERGRTLTELCPGAVAIAPEVTLGDH